MAAQMQELRARLRSVDSTRKITRAQELIAASRIGRAQVRAAATTPYCRAITAVLSTLAAASTLDHPLLTPRPDPTRAGVVVVTSDRGMCGGYNAKVLRAGEDLQQRLRGESKESVLYVMGQKGAQFYTFRGRAIAGCWNGFSQQPSYADAAAVSEQLVALFLTGGAGTVVGGAAETTFGIDELHIVSTRFTSMFTQTPIVRQIGPLKNTNDEHNGITANNVVHPRADGRPLPDYVFEPRAELLLEALLPQYFVTRIYSALLDSAVSELAARRTAMHAATDNANDLALSLGRQINHARQAQITEDLNEIISGADALAADAAKEDHP